MAETPEDIMRKALDKQASKEIKDQLLIHYKKSQDAIISQVSKLFEASIRNGTWSWEEMAKYNKAERLFSAIQGQVKQLGITEEKSLRSILEETYKDEYARKCIQMTYELQGKDWSEIKSKYALDNYEENYYNIIKNSSEDIKFNLIDETQLKQILTFPWSGDNFSNRLWHDKDLLIRSLRQELTQSMILGESMFKAAERIKGSMGTSAYNCERLARTEIMRMSNEAHIQAFQENDIQESEWYAAEDERTCPVCGGRHEKKYDIDKRPTMPAHPHCRCTWIAVVESRMIKEPPKEVMDTKVETNVENKPTLNELKSKYKQIAARYDNPTDMWMGLTEAQQQEFSSYLKDAGLKRKDFFAKINMDNKTEPTTTTAKVNNNIKPIPKETKPAVETKKPETTKKVAKVSKEPIAKEEKAAVKYYTGDEGYIAIRSGKAPKEAELLESYIDKSKKYTGEVYRGMGVNKEFIKQLKVGGSIDMHGVSSWAADEKVARDFVGSSESQSVIFKVNTQKYGADISKLSKYKNEKEILMSGKANYKIQSVTKKKYTEGYVITVEKEYYEVILMEV